MKGVVIPQNGSFYEKLEKLPVGKFKYWSELLLEGNGEKILQNLMNFKETAEQVSNSAMAMDLIMEGVPIASGERVKATLWCGMIPSGSQNTYYSVYTVPVGYKVIITDFIVGYSGSIRLAIDETFKTELITPTTENPTQQIYLYQEVNAGSKIQVFGNYNKPITIIGYKIKL